MGYTNNMENIVPIVFSVVLVVLTIVLSVVGIQMILVLSEVRRTLRRVNDTLEMIEDKVVAIVSPFQNLGGALSGLKTGMHLFETFTSYLNKSSSKSNK